MKRKYDSFLLDHFSQNDEMIFIAGPRQVGKTTTALAHDPASAYLNWDNEQDRLRILKGPQSLAEFVGIRRTLVLDEFHKYPQWKNFLKGFYDSYGRKKHRIIVTGSALLNVYQKGADSLLGRFFLHRMHPLSAGELVNQDFTETEISSPRRIPDEKFQRLLKYGGFPQPFVKNSSRFYNRWRNMRTQLVLGQDLRDLTRIQEISQVEVLAMLIQHQAGQIANYTTLAKKIRASLDSVRRWLTALESLYYCFTIRPWSKNVSRSLLKEPKVYLWDWSVLEDPGARHENFVASHLLKAIHWWNDNGFGHYGLYFLRTKDKRGVDFVVTRQDEPWFMVEVKSSTAAPLSRWLDYFHTRIETQHAFQLVFDMEDIDANCFDFHHPVKVPAKTFLSQLV